MKHFQAVCSGRANSVAGKQCEMGGLADLRAKL
jgi:hypothetical protein